MGKLNTYRGPETKVGLCVLPFLCYENKQKRFEKNVSFEAAIIYRSLQFFLLASRYTKSHLILLPFSGCNNKNWHNR